MKSALSLTSIVCLVASALPLTAQEQTVTPRSLDLRDPASQATAGPLAGAVTREAVRLGAGREPPSSGVETFRQGGKPAGPCWSRVRELAPGAEIIVTVKGSPPGRRYFAAAATKSSTLPPFRPARPSIVKVPPFDEPDLTVLNVADPMLPAEVRDVLRAVASSHPDYFLAAQNGGQSVLEKSVRMGPDGVFVADRRVADLGQIVERIARADILEIRTPGIGPARRTARGLLGGFAGLFIGGMIGGMVGISMHASNHDANLGGMLVGMTAGGTGGAILGSRMASRKTGEVICRVP